ncbi:MAG: ABC transporter permease [Erysipelothrix sp.]|nr:ABC transporter permease [Erysipelothrix sp.]
MLKNKKIMIPLISVLLGLVIGSFLLLITGKNPLILFEVLFEGITGFQTKRGQLFNIRYTGELLVSAMPLMLTGLSIAFAYRTGLFNIGAEGQVIMGSLFTYFVATNLDLPPLIHIPLCFVAGAVGGALWGVIPGILKAYFNIIEVVVGIMLNYVAMYVSNYIVMNMEGYKNLVSPPINPSASLRVPWLTDLFGGSRFHLGFIIVILGVITYWFIIEKTTYGYNLRATGFNKDGAEYAGLKVNRNIISSMAIAGAYSGLAGSVLTLGTFGDVKSLASLASYGFDGIAVALVGNLSGIGIVLAGLLFGLLGFIPPMLQLRGVPLEIASIIAALIVFFVAAQRLIEMSLSKLREKKLAKNGDKEEGVA